MEDYKLSIIVPLYNSGQYIAGCLDSIIASDLPDGEYEVIIVNDGSNDNGPELVKPYLEKYSNFRIIHQENQGLSSARNNGINHSKGSYFWCVDSDDYVDDRLARILPYLDGKTDVVSTYLKLVKEDGSLVKYSKDHRVPYNKKISGRDVVIRGFNPTSVCGHFIRRQFVIDNQLFFVPGKTHQDVELSYRLFAHASEVLFLDISSYVYVLHPNSISQSKSVEKKKKFTLDDIFVYNSFKNLAASFAETDKQLSEVISTRAESVLFGLLASLYNNKKEWGRNGITKAVLTELRSQHIYPLKGPFYSKKHRRMSYLLNLPFIYYPLWRKNH